MGDVQPNPRQLQPLPGRRFQSGPAIRLPRSKSRALASSLNRALPSAQAAEDAAAEHQALPQTASLELIVSVLVKRPSTFEAMGAGPCRWHPQVAGDYVQLADSDHLQDQQTVAPSGNCEGACKVNMPYNSRIPCTCVAEAPQISPAGGAGRTGTGVLGDVTTQNPHISSFDSYGKPSQDRTHKYTKTSRHLHRTSPYTVSVP